MRRLKMYLFCSLLFSLVFPQFSSAASEILVVNVEHTSGASESVVQEAINYAFDHGGGIVKVSAGTYTFRNSLFLKNNVSLVGVDGETVFKKDITVTKQITQDSDHYEKVLHLNSTNLLNVGDGLIIQSSTNPYLKVTRATIIEIVGNDVILNQKLGENYWLNDNVTVKTIHPLVIGIGVNNISISNITLEGNKEKNDNINGNYSGAVYLEGSSDLKFNNVTAQNYNGDGFSIQASNNITFNQSKSLNNANLGFHFGGGSNNVQLLNGITENNGIDGVFFCWGVTNSIVKNTLSKGNKRFGVYFHRKNTDNQIIANEIINNGVAGIVLNTQSNNLNTSNRNSILNNLIQDNGSASRLIGIDVKAFTSDIEIKGNKFVNTKNISNDFGIMKNLNTTNINVEDNVFEGIHYEQYTY